MSALFQHFRNKLSCVYPPREANALALLVFEEVFGVTRTDVYADKIKQISEEESRRLDNIAARLLCHEPVQYVLGSTLFCGHRFAVNSSVLIPRPETEDLVALVTEEQKGRSIRLLDGGTGSGCIAVSLALALPDAEVEAWDISPEALAVAQKNAQANQAQVDFRLQSLLEAAPENCRFDCIVSNPPYVRELEKSTMEANVLNYEPRLALFVPDNDPLLFYRALADLGKATLAPGGVIYAEINEYLGKETASLFKERGYRDTEILRDAFGKERMLKAASSNFLH